MDIMNMNGYANPNNPKVYSILYQFHQWGQSKKRLPDFEAQCIHTASREKESFCYISRDSSSLVLPVYCKPLPQQAEKVLDVDLPATEVQQHCELAVVCHHLECRGPCNDCSSS